MNTINKSYKMVSLSELRGTNCTDDERYEYCKMSQVCDNETPSE